VDQKRLIKIVRRTTSHCIHTLDIILGRKKLFYVKDIMLKNGNMKYLHRKTEVWPISRSRLIIKDTKLKTLESIDNFYYEEIFIENNKQLEYINFSTFNESSKLRSLKILKIPTNNSDKQITKNTILFKCKSF